MPGRFFAWGIGAVAAGAGISWWALGADTFGTPQPFGLGNPIWRPPVLMSDQPWVLGVLGILLVVAHVAFRAVRSNQQFPARSTQATGALFVVGLLLGACGRLMSAEGVDSNIGGGVALVFGLPLLAAAILFILWHGQRRAALT